MIQDIAADIALEKHLKSRFHDGLNVHHMIVRELPVSRMATADIFMTSKNQLFAFLQAQGPMTTGDVRKIMRHMGCEVDEFLPPITDKNYFTRVATEKFRATYPGRTPLNDDDLRYYYTLVPYNPALVKIQAITNGVIYQFDPTSESSWRPAAKLVYRTVKTS